MTHDMMRYVFLMVATWLLSGQAQVTDASDPADRRVEPRRIILDTDPGGDDALALLWLQSLAKQGVVEIVAVTTVAGNVNGEYTFANASRTLSLGGFEEVEVGRCVRVGAKAEDASHIHGSDGLGGLSRTLPAPRHSFARARAAHEIIIDKLAAEPGEITLVAIGPLTNLAAAEDKCPGILAKAKEIVVMGGVFRREGNITAQAEFNIWYDPPSAARVFASRNDLVVLPLDVTQQVTFTEDRARDLRRAAPDDRIAKFIDGLCRSMTATSMSYRATKGIRGFHVHDATTLAYLFYPETLLLRRAQIHVETEGEWTRGQTIFDDRHLAKTTTNAWVAMQVDAANLLAIMTEDLKTLIDVE
jgi:inosine-uridine nucleoside N-ribohydrolase